MNVLKKYDLYKNFTNDEIGRNADQQKAWKEW